MSDDRKPQNGDVPAHERVIIPGAEFDRLKAIEQRAIACKRATKFGSARGAARYILGEISGDGLV